MGFLFGVKRKINDCVYDYVVKPICFSQDPERVHNFFIYCGKILGKIGIGKAIVRVLFNYQDKILEQRIYGIKFRNPIGLSAGFDKNAELVSIMEDVGFGFVEVGSVTARACSGNSGIRLKRVLDKKGIWVNLGLNNDGADEIEKRLNGRKFKIPFGVSIARTNCKEAALEKEGIKDYVYSFGVLQDVGDYITLNISCPNSYGGQPFSEPKRYEKLLKKITPKKIRKPIFVKLSPDLDNGKLDKIIEISMKYGISGFICSNLTKKGEVSSGGFSGKIVEDKSNQLLEYVYRKTKGECVLIGAGGIFSAEDAYRKIRLGANLVQLITGMIFKGPALIGEINYDLTRLLKRDGFKNIGEFVGKDVK